MTKTGIFFCFLFLIPLVSASRSITHRLSFFTNNTAPTRISVGDGSKIYLTSRDRAAQLAKITLTSNGIAISLDKLLNNFDDYGFTKGWPVNSDLTISTTNSVNVTQELKGELFICTPTMAQDPNFLVMVVRGNKLIDRSSSGISTIVFLTNFNSNTTGMPNYAGFKHTRIESIAQSQTTKLSIYRDYPDDYYGDYKNANNTRKTIFSNPLRHANGQTTFFQSIDPMQFTESMWFRAIGGFQITVSDNYEDTSTIVAGDITITGMTNNQLLTNPSQVTFRWQGVNRYGSTGYVVSSDLFTQSNLTLQLNGAAPSSDSYTVTGQQNAYNMIREVNWHAVNLQLQPSGMFTGIYYVQYFNIDNGAVTNASTQATAGSAATTSQQFVSSSPSASSTLASGTQTTPQSTTLAVQTTTKSSATAVVIISVLSTLLHYVRDV